jgi:hypothetical protein
MILAIVCLRMWWEWRAGSGLRGHHAPRDTCVTRSGATVTGALDLSAFQSRACTGTRADMHANAWGEDR